MRNLLKKLPFPVEFAVVLVFAFGWTLIPDLLEVLHLKAASNGLNETGLWRMLGTEAVLLAGLGLFLAGRGWNGARFGLVSVWSDGLWALGLALGVQFAFSAVYALLQVVAPAMLPSGVSGPAVPSLSVTVVVAMVLIDSFFDEFFLIGYVMSALKEKGLPNLAFNLSIAIRVLEYASRGPLEVLLIIPFGLIFTIWYALTGRLWPVILAHTLFNVVFLAPHIKW